jgi:hypothetical protein
MMPETVRSGTQTKIKLNSFAVYDLLYLWTVYIILDLPTIHGFWKIY